MNKKIQGIQKVFGYLLLSAGVLHLLEISLTGGNFFGGLYHRIGPKEGMMLAFVYLSLGFFFILNKKRD